MLPAPLVAGAAPNVSVVFFIASRLPKEGGKGAANFTPAARLAPVASSKT
jgi:hypothetical protein